MGYVMAGVEDVIAEGRQLHTYTCDNKDIQSFSGNGGDVLERDIVMF